MRHTPPAWLIGILAWVAGYIDAVGYLVLGRVFMANMTGNTEVFALALTQRDLHRAFERGLPIALFVGGAALGSLLAESGDGTRHLARAWWVEALMLAGFVLLARTAAPPAGTGAWIAQVLLLAGALGVQNAALTHPGTRGTHSTHVTGPITDFATDLVRSIRRTSDDNPPRPSRMRRLSMRWVGFFAGALSGSWLYAWTGVAAPLLPAAVIAVLAVAVAPE
jgi:uncharacterized membrane protein YoaK (UPF0700 family)